MTYHWPFEKPDLMLQRALDIALSYLDTTGQASIFRPRNRMRPANT
jgi:hypothetical protein